MKLYKKLYFLVFPRLSEHMAKKVFLVNCKFIISTPEVKVMLHHH